jgi:hypothetical protein
MMILMLRSSHNSLPSPAMMMQIRPVYDFVVPSWIVMVLALMSDNILRTCQAERTVIVSTRVGRTYQNRTSCDTADTLSAGENFDNCNFRLIWTSMVA